MKKVITLKNSENIIIEKIEIKNGENLKRVLVDKNIIEFPCSGLGICGKCKVKLEEDIDYTNKELEILSEHEINSNVHLACMVHVNKDLTVIFKENRDFTVLTEINSTMNELNTGMEIMSIKDIIPGASTLSNIQIIEDYLKPLGKWIDTCDIRLVRDIHKFRKENHEVKLLIKDNKVVKVVKKDARSYGVAVDIGTTTIAMYLYNLLTGEHIGSKATINPQRKFGHDVISRISYANTEKHLNELRISIVDELNKMILSLAEVHRINIEEINNMIIAANTTMNHLLVGADVSSFGKAPFTPQFLNMLTLKGRDIGFDNFRNLDVLIINNISSFVGGDLVSGIVDTDLDILDEYNLLIDIGTNGEIILGNKDEIVCCATAAGPAFEAANITCGVGSIEGAICKVYKEEGKLKVETIGGKKPIGICGTGLIDLIAYLLDEEIIDEVGYMEENFIIDKDEEGNEIFITPKDIREIQLAKAAIRAGIDTLIEHENLKIDDLDNIFIAGGFGNYLNVDSAIRIGLIPDSKEKLISVGNSAGSGACKLLLNSKLIDRARGINSKSAYIELSSNVKFMDKYIENMIF